MKELKLIGKRLSEFMSHKSIGVNQMGRLTGTSGAQIHNIMKGKKYGTDKLLNIFKAFPELSILWLLNNDGEMINNFTGSKKKKLNAEGQESLIKENKDLKKEVGLLKLKNEKLKGAVSYQEMTIQAYKNSVNILTDTNEGLKDVIKSEKEDSSNLRAS